MPPQVVHLPDGQHITVTPVFAGLFFKSNELSTVHSTSHHHAFPIGWSIVIHTEDRDKAGPPARPRSQLEDKAERVDGTTSDSPGERPEPRVHAFTTPTLDSDCLFISSISNPNSDHFKPAASPTRQIAMMLWVTLYWYFHQRAPRTELTNKDSMNTPEAGRPLGEWRVRVKKDGVFRGRNLIPKLERMGLIATHDSSVGTSKDPDAGWSHMFVSQRMFWQIPERLFLFTLQPNPKSNNTGLLSYPGSPSSSRPGSPTQFDLNITSPLSNPEAFDLPVHPPIVLTSAPSFPIGPYFSASHLPTYYPPPPLQYTFTNHTRHPVRPKPPRMGEIFYMRYIPSVGQYLSFRVASNAPAPVPYTGPVGSKPPPHPHLSLMTDTALLQYWHANPRVSAFWGQYAAGLLDAALRSHHSFPVIGMWDGVPFGYFELYWVKEDVLGRHVGGAAADDWDRGCHVLIGEEWARGRVQSWLTSLVHWAFSSDYRTMSMCLEPRVDNARYVYGLPGRGGSDGLTEDRFIQHLEYAGFTKEREIAFPHKQAWFGRLRRENWVGPGL